MSKPFFVATSKNKPPRTGEAVDVAARHLVYKLYEATDRIQGAWHVVDKIGEQPATVAKAVERGWVITRDVGPKGKLVSASLTSEGRVLARKGLR